MDDPGTDSLRKLAPSWTLAGDEQLLTILQSTHQRLLSKCQEANCQLEQMATVLSDASISLQNVNNQFMALSSSQFIESRVYDDDDIGTEVTDGKEPPKPEIPDEISSLKRSISVLENAHEIITILHDSDTESDSDDEVTARLVLKPKDMYADRPLPYIIGSEPWKSKWHAGLLLEDSDSDSSASKAEHDTDQYSSEPEDTRTDKLQVPHTHTVDTTVSETSSELPSEQGSVPKPTPSDVASEIARRLGGRDPPKMVERQPEYEEPVKPQVRKIYRPQDPVPTTIFSESPPPLSEPESEGSDIFAELHRSQPYARTEPATDLFNEEKDDIDEGDIFSDFATKPVTDPSAKPSLFDSGPTPHMFQKYTDDRTVTTIHNDYVPGDGRTKSGYEKNRVGSEDRGNGDDGRQDDRVRRDSDEVDRVKKPVGGISLFGNKGTESIGAAILKRNQRKSSTSGDESGSDSRSEAPRDQQIRKEKDIFDDLFARSEVKKATKNKPDFVKDIKTEIQKKSEEKIKDKSVEKVKVDLFSDNLFDDIDDIFSSNLVKMPSKDNAKIKSIFEDDDDLFSEIAAPKPMKIEVASSSNNKKSLFDSDDELFSENIPKPTPAAKPRISEKPTEVNKPAKINENSTKVSEPPKVNKEMTRSIFEDEENDIFSDVKTNKINEVIKVQNSPISSNNYNDISKVNEETSKNVNLPKTTSNVFKSPSLFDDDDDDKNGLFVEPAKSSNIKNDTAVVNKDIKELPSKNEIKIPEKILDVSSYSVTNDFKQNVIKNDGSHLNKETSVTVENNKVIDNTFDSDKNSKNDSNTPVTQNVDSDNKNINKAPNVKATKVFNHIEENSPNVENSSSDISNDFSDQDFDDLPPKLEETPKNVNSYTNMVTEPEAIKPPSGLDNIYGNNTLGDDDLEKTNSDTIFKTTEPDVLKTINEELNKTEKDNNTNQPAAKTIESDIFSDILTEPPEFEKPKEPKKSKNVNALFDDDSDDESLFFKKNEPIFDENLEDFTPKQDRLFGLFTDEPPDDGFNKISDDLDDMFSTMPKPKSPQKDYLPPIPAANNFQDIAKPDNKVPEIETIHSEEDIFSTLPKNTTKPSDYPKAPAFDTLKDTSEDLFRLPDPKNNGPSPISEQKATTFSDDEQLFNILKKESKPSIEEKQDMFSNDDNLFSPAPKLEKTGPSPLPKQEVSVLKKSKNLQIENPDDGLFNSLTNTEKPSGAKSVEDNKNTDLKSDEDLFKMPKKPDIKTKSENNIKSLDTQLTSPKSENTETKRVGKIKMGLNINVNALLPGASPKKVKQRDHTDGQAQSVAENQKLESQINPENQESEPTTPENQNTDSKLLKSVSFDGKPESDILDNKLSKERAKIQVKRRPSTRKARREAVRKSGIDFGEDSTDNSSSIDDPPRIPIGNQPEVSKKADKEDANTEVTQKVQNESIDQTKVQAKSDSIAVQPEIPTTNESMIEPENQDKQPEITEKPSYSRDVKSKVVYILNDEDIFNTSPVDKPDLNKSPDRNIGSNSGVTTIGKVYDKSETKSNKKDSKISLFGDENDEEIFKAKASVKKSSIFDSDSEEELFGTSKKEVEKVEIKKEIKREVVKVSLFGDDDDDDLFGVKTKKSVDQKPQASRLLPKETPKPAEPVFEDPLSMFGDDD